jgi:hypothetical protein
VHQNNSWYKNDYAIIIFSASPQTNIYSIFYEMLGVQIKNTYMKNDLTQQHTNNTPFGENPNQENTPTKRLCFITHHRKITNL